MNFTQAAQYLLMILKMKEINNLHAAFNKVFLHLVEFLKIDQLATWLSNLLQRDTPQ